MSAAFDLQVALSEFAKLGRVLICPHTDPDPDALAGAWAMATLFREELKTPAIIGFDGIIGRAENRAMVRKLKLPLRPLQSLDPADYDGVLLIDTQPGAGNHSAPASLPVLGCVDHHPRTPPPEGMPWCDVRPDVGSTAVIALRYLRDLSIEVSKGLATAILYAIKTDTRDFTREASGPDLDAYRYLLPRADLRALGAIANPELDDRYFLSLHQALDVVREHGRAVTLFLEELAYPDLVAEMADLFVRRDQTDWCLCGGTYEGSLRFSIRSELADAEAGRLARSLVRSHEGSAGGHGMTAGGRVALAESPTPQAVDALWRDIVARFLEGVDAPTQQGQLLYPCRHGHCGGQAPKEQ